VSLFTKTRKVKQFPVLCNLWQEDGVWNGVADDLPVAVFGATFEEAQANLCQALMSHLEALQEVGKLEETVALTEAQAQDTAKQAREARVKALLDAPGEDLFQFLLHKGCMGDYADVELGRSSFIELTNQFFKIQLQACGSRRTLPAPE